jgi:hypothetical protein
MSLNFKKAESFRAVEKFNFCVITSSCRCFIFPYINYNQLDIIKNQVNDSMCDALFCLHKE